MMKNIKKTILVAAFFLAYSVCVGQQEKSQLDSVSIKKILYHSLVCDQISILPYYYINTFDNYYLQFDKFRYYKSKKLRLHTKPYSPKESNYDVYSVQLFKFYGFGGDGPYYVLTIDECYDCLHVQIKEDIWVRLSGFTESDIKLVLDYVINDQNLTMDDIKYMIDCWRQGDELFNELDWDCLIDGYLTNDLRRKCYMSWTKIDAAVNLGLKAQDPRELDNYASFSTDYPLCGSLK